MDIELLLFDAANTIIYKPDLFYKIQTVLKNNGFEIAIDEIKLKHKILSESIAFPDRTNKDFYFKFNSELLYSLGVIPSNELLEKIFVECSYLPWKKFDDVEVLNNIAIPKIIISNFNSSLHPIIDSQCNSIFTKVFISEEIKFRKPSLDFYSIITKNYNYDPSNILYIGDSLKLDICPGNKMGFKTLLIDRDNIYPSVSNRISTFEELIDKILKT